MGKFRVMLCDIAYVMLCDIGYVVSASFLDWFQKWNEFPSELPLNWLSADI